ncbi:hypothetical protein GCM10017621_30690 [Maricaulis virginensis]|uniref:Uncharacterized protein n=1 Tax=Maricaulis virginensis TaxID=144022 RepID=A0A9W6MQ39_9PROT|nr:hypothetical protein GCM10017621_30690 [Maricaulis virginensis]
MLSGVATFTQSFALAVRIIPRRAARHISLVMHLQYSAIFGAAGTAHTPTTIELDDFLAEEEPVRMPI